MPRFLERRIFGGVKKMGEFWEFRTTFLADDGGEENFCGELVSGSVGRLGWLKNRAQIGPKIEKISSHVTGKSYYETAEKAHSIGLFSPRKRVLVVRCALVVAALGADWNGIAPRMHTRKHG